MLPHITKNNITTNVGVDVNHVICLVSIQTSSLSVQYLLVFLVITFLLLTYIVNTFAGAFLPFKFISPTNDDFSIKSLVNAVWIS